jgi:hypothetical protein
LVRSSSSHTLSTHHPSTSQPQDVAVAVAPPQEPTPPTSPAPHQPPTAPAAMSTANKKRPRLDLNLEGGRERKRGKTVFGILLGTLNKAKTEDKERNASEAVCRSLLLFPLFSFLIPFPHRQKNDS